MLVKSLFLVCGIFVTSFMPIFTTVASEVAPAFNPKIFADRVKNDEDPSKTLSDLRQMGCENPEKTDPKEFIRKVNDVFLPRLKKLFPEGAPALCQYNPEIKQLLKFSIFTFDSLDTNLSNLSIEIEAPYRLTIKLNKQHDNSFSNEICPVPILKPQDFKEDNEKKISYHWHHFLQNICTDSDLAYAFACCSFLLTEPFRFVITKEVRVESFMWMGKTVNKSIPLDVHMIKKLFSLGRTIYEITEDNISLEQKRRAFQTYLSNLIDKSKEKREKYLNEILLGFKKKYKSKGVVEVNDSFYVTQKGSCVIS